MVKSITKKIQEISSIVQTTVDVKIDESIDVKRLTKGDDDPIYANVEVIRTGVVSGNRRRYDDNCVRGLAEMIIGTQGFLGHPDPEKTSFEFRIPQCVFVGKEIEPLPDSSGSRLIAKAYIYPDSPLRKWVPISLITGKPLTVSINGVADLYYNDMENVIDVLQFVKLDSIDWANTGTEGIGSSQALSIVNEMLGGENMDPNTPRQAIVSQVTISEMRTFNAPVLEMAIRETTVEELQRLNPRAVQAIQDAARVTEMALKVDGTDKTVKLADVQSIITGYEDTIHTLNTTIETQKVTEIKQRELGKIADPKIREKVEKRIVGTTEAEIVASVASEVAYISEMTGMRIDNPPIGQQPTTATDKDVTLFKNVFGVVEPDKQ
jgi:hypothetical protein